MAQLIRAMACQSRKTRIEKSELDEGLQKMLKMFYKLKGVTVPNRSSAGLERRRRRSPFRGFIIIIIIIVFFYHYYYYYHCYYYYYYYYYYSFVLESTSSWSSCENRSFVLKSLSS